MPTEVIATLRADQQIAGLDRTHARVFGEFLDDLAARGCQALGYRLSGPAPVDHICVKHLRDSLRVVVAFEGQQRAWILLVGRHDDQDPVLNVYAELYRLLGVEPPDSAGRDKPPCCDESTDLPPVLGAAVTEFVDRAAKVRRTRRQPTSLPAWAWVFGIARRVYASYCEENSQQEHKLRRLAGRRDLDQDQVEELLERIDAERAGHDLITGLATLPERDRAVIELVDIAGLRPKEAAAALGLTPGTVRMRLMRTRARQRKEAVHNQALRKQAMTAKHIRGDSND